MGRYTKAAALIAALWWTAAALSAHDARNGFVTFTPSHPRTGQPGEVQVSLRGIAGEPVTLDDARVRIIADMTAHKMTPVEVDLTRKLPGEVRAGTIKFTMPGEWRITVRLEEPDGNRVAVFPLTVLRRDASGADRPVAIAVEFDAEARPTVFNPWAVVAFAIGLTLAAEAAAIAAAWRRQARARVQPVAGRARDSESAA